MKKLFDMRSCKNCGTSFNWMRTMITSGNERWWDDIVEAHGVDCCDNPEMNNDQWVGMIYLEV